jgi:hypothetical protein
VRRLFNHCALAERGVADRRVGDDVAVVTKAALQESRCRDVELTEHGRGFIGIAGAVDDEPNLLRRFCACRNLDEGVGIDDRCRLE